MKAANKSLELTARVQRFSIQPSSFLNVPFAKASFPLLLLSSTFGAQ